MARVSKHELGVGILVVVSLSLLSWMSLQVGALDGWGVEMVAAEVVLPDAAGLEAGAVVKVAGVEVGTVDAVRVDHDKAVLDVSLQSEAAIRSDVVAQVRARSLLGEKYLALLPQTRDAPLLASGARVERALPVTELDELINSLGPMVGAADSDELSSALSTVSQAINRDPERIERILADVEAIASHGRTASEALPGLITDADRTLGTVRGVVAEARPVLQRADTLLVTLEPAARELPDTVSQAHGLMTDGRVLVGELRTVSGALEGSTDDLVLILDNLSKVDEWTIRQLMREEGLKVRLREKKVTRPEP